MFSGSPEEFIGLSLDVEDKGDKGLSTKSKNLGEKAIKIILSSLDKLNEIFSLLEESKRQGHFTLEDDDKEDNLFKL